MPRRSGIRFNPSDAGAASASAASPVLWNIPQFARDAACAAEGDRRRQRIIDGAGWTGSPHASFETAPLYRDRTAVRAVRAHASRRRSFGRKRTGVRRAQLGKQAPCHLEATRLEALGKSLIDGRQHIVRLLAAAASLPQSRKRDRRAKLVAQRPLMAGDVERL